MKHFFFFLLLILSFSMASKAQNSKASDIQVQITSNDRMYGKIYVEFFNEKGLLYDRLIYEAVIVGTGSMRFGLLGDNLLNLPSNLVRGEFKSDGHRYVLEAFKRKLMEVTGMDVDLRFVPSKIVQES